MIKSTLILFLIVFGLHQTSFPQTCPANIDFESGDFSKWECFTGSTGVENGTNKIGLTRSGPVSNRHEIITATSGNQLDPFGKFPTLCPYGGKYSVKLGNDNTGSEAEGLSYTFTVPTTVDTFTFTYFYAVVFEDPQHPLPEQPRFFVTAYEVSTGNVINCASFDYVSNGAIPGFERAEQNPSVLFKKWSPASLQFAGLGGKNVRLEFKTADCTPGGHFGYAYVDVGSACSNILATAPYCKETNALILNAPYGFKSYTWYNENFSSVVGNDQSLTLTPPPATTGVFYVDVIPYPGFGCRDTLQATVVPLPVPDTPSSKSELTYCQHQQVSALTAKALPGHEILWYTSASGGTPSTDPPVPSTALPGVYAFYVSQKVLFGCESFRKKITVNIVPTPNTSFGVNSLQQCRNTNQYVFASTSNNLANPVFSWDFGDGKSVSSVKDSIANHIYQNPASFDVKLKVTNEKTCFSERTIRITVYPNPVASFNYPNIICEKQTAVNLVNTSTVPTGVSTITSSWWSIDGAVQNSANPPVFIPDHPGPLVVKQVVATEHGCISDTNKSDLTVRYRPAAALKYSTPLCNNVTIAFTDMSLLAKEARNESIVKWQWEFDNNNSSSSQHTATNFNGGIHHARLIAETNFGCRSLAADSLIVITEKPSIRLEINDSCINRLIKYQGVDVTNTVDKWHWDFGGGFYGGPSSVSKTYRTEGYRALTLIAETAKGCKDTLVRPFTIYDNKAFAGRDTITAMNEPVQLNAHGGPTVTYVWTPSIGLDNPGIENPVATYDRDQLYILDAVTDKGCDSHSRIMIKRFKGPQLYIPTAFTPNADGLNDVLKVFPVGIRSFKYFAVYNRFGQKIFYTTDYNTGWDGTFNGNNLDTGTFAVYAAAIDYKGALLETKNTVTLIR